MGRNVHDFNIHTVIQVILCSDSSLWIDRSPSSSSTHPFSSHQQRILFRGPSLEIIFKLAPHDAILTSIQNLCPPKTSNLQKIHQTKNFHRKKTPPGISTHKGLHGYPEHHAIATGITVLRHLPGDFLVKNRKTDAMRA